MLVRPDALGRHKNRCGNSKIEIVMAYHLTTKTLLRSKPMTLGVKLGRLATRRKISVQELAARTGASRTTIYSWFAGRGVTNAYRKPVEELIKELRKPRTT
jgi:hypothetical protein